MSSKAEVLAKVINTNTYIGSAVRGMINDITCEESPTVPKHLKKYDVIRVKVNMDGSGKPRPAVIISVKKDYVVAIPLTSAEGDVKVLCEYKGNRFFKDGFFCNSYVIVQTEIARQSFLGTFDDNKTLNNAIKELRLFINGNI